MVTASAILEETSIVDRDDFGDFGEAAYELEGIFLQLLNEEKTPALCSALGVVQPALCEAILMANGITDPGTIPIAIDNQRESGSPFDPHAPPETAPQQLRKLHEALAPLTPHAI